MSLPPEVQSYANAYTELKRYYNELFLQCVYKSGGGREAVLQRTRGAPRAVIATALDLMIPIGEADLAVLCHKWLYDGKTVLDALETSPWTGEDG